MLLIAALASRALAQSAHRAGIAAVALDLFDDLDTRGYAVATRKIAARADGDGFDADDLLQAAQALCPRERCSGVVVGAGFEDCPDLLARLCQGRELFGNTPETIARLKHPASFFGLLDSLEIPHPPIAFKAPDDLEGWLVKKAGGSGGSHVTTATEQPPSTGSYYSGPYYYQRLVLGRSVSALFLADGERARIVGFNQQWKAGRTTAYAYGGAINRVMLGQDLQNEIARQLDRLVAETGLVGLNGMDFLISGETGAAIAACGANAALDAINETRGNDYNVLEINPRPPATLDLYDADFPLFEWHMRACRGQLPPKQSLPTAVVRAHAVVYAEGDVTIAPDTHFAAWCSDIAPPGRLIARGAPVCTVHAQGGEPNAVMRALRAREQLIDIALWKKAA